MQEWRVVKRKIAKIIQSKTTPFLVRYDAFLEKYFREFVFIHINKTAGTSIEKALAIQFRHRTALEVIEELGYELWEKKFTFTFVRNPWDRVVSHYHYRLASNQTDLRANPISFKEWVKRTYRDKDPHYFNNPKMFMPQIEWITNSQGDILVDFIGHFENLQTDFELVCAKLGRNAVLPYLKKSRRIGYREYYDDETIAIINDWFKKDIELLGYQFNAKNVDS
ncbi:MAG: sulfotransferase family protein [Chloroflexi bacterium]|nr:sulfotransferase family protein [Chloroflexota bacterium]